MTHHPNKDAHRCARVVYTVLVVGSNEQGIHVEQNSITADIPDLPQYVYRVLERRGFGGITMQGSIILAGDISR